VYRVPRMQAPSDWFTIAFTCAFNGSTNRNTLKERDLLAGGVVGVQMSSY